MKIPTKETLALPAILFALAFCTPACTEKEESGHEGETAEEHADHEHEEGDHDHEGHEGEGDHDHEGEGDHQGEHSDHDHDSVHAGPNGGRVLHAVEPHLEFLVTDDRKVRISAVEDGEIVPIGDQSVTVVGGSRSNPTRMSFAKTDGTLVSDAAFPQGNGFPVVVRIQASEGAETQTEKFNLDLKDCPTCEYQEYACACEHGEHESHDHAEES